MVSNRHILSGHFQVAEYYTARASSDIITGVSLQPLVEPQSQAQCHWSKLQRGLVRTVIDEELNRFDMSTDLIATDVAWLLKKHSMPNRVYRKLVGLSNQRNHDASTQKDVHDLYQLTVLLLSPDLETWGLITIEGKWYGNL